MSKDVLEQSFPGARGTTSVNYVWTFHKYIGYSTPNDVARDLDSSL